MRLKGKIINGKINNYKLLDHLADGGNGMVWKAEYNDRYYAIKFLKKKKWGIKTEYSDLSKK
ncbi:hypothetical protein SD457_10600 [Coprobacillaceae bacterium CR2/5/TPMF4]|nr:hypothetical protein SD457_10600 [Coprobacillaceae bacterium CR2/5/TPMF4]